MNANVFSNSIGVSQLPLSGCRRFLCQRLRSCTWTRWILSLSLLFELSPGSQAQFTYTTNNGAITLARYSGGGDVIISNFVNIIGDYAFGY
jgi:hypothetical protein